MTPYRERREAGDFDPQPAVDLDALTKAELVAYADAHGIDVDASASKADVRAAIDQAAG